VKGNFKNLIGMCDSVTLNGSIHTDKSYEATLQSLFPYLTTDFLKNGTDIPFSLSTLVQARTENRKSFSSFSTVINSISSSLHFFSTPLSPTLTLESAFRDPSPKSHPTFVGTNLEGVAYDASQALIEVCLQFLC